MSKDIQLTLDVLEECLKTLRLLNMKLQDQQINVIPPPQEPPWITIAEYLADNDLNWYDKSERTSLGLQLKSKMDSMGLAPIKNGKSNRYPQKLIHEAVTS